MQRDEVGPAAVKEAGRKRGGVARQLLMSALRNEQSPFKWQNGGRTARELEELANDVVSMVLCGHVSFFEQHWENPRLSGPVREHPLFGLGADRPGIDWRGVLHVLHWLAHNHAGMPAGAWLLHDVSMRRVPPPDLIAFAMMNRASCPHAGWLLDTLQRGQDHRDGLVRRHVARACDSALMLTGDIQSIRARGSTWRGAFSARWWGATEFRCLGRSGSLELLEWWYAECRIASAHPELQSSDPILTDNDWNVICGAAREGHTTLIERLLSAQKESFWLKNVWCAVREAATYGRVEVLALLFERASVSLLNRQLLTTSQQQIAIHRCATNGHLGALRYLCEQAACEGAGSHTLLGVVFTSPPCTRAIVQFLLASDLEHVSVTAEVIVSAASTRNVRVDVLHLLSSHTDNATWDQVMLHPKVQTDPGLQGFLHSIRAFLHHPGPSSPMHTQSSLPPPPPPSPSPQSSPTSPLPVRLRWVQNTAGGTALATRVQALMRASCFGGKQLVFYGAECLNTLLNGLYSVQRFADGFGQPETCQLLLVERQGRECALEAFGCCFPSPTGAEAVADDGSVLETHSQGPELHIEAVFVAPACFGRGHGTRLLREMEAWGAREHQCTTAILDASLTALEFYRARGYEEVQRVLPGPNEDDTGEVALMRKQLSGCSGMEVATRPQKGRFD